MGLIDRIVRRRPATDTPDQAAAATDELHAHPIAGSDVAWLAVDPRGHVGLFTVFGTGPRPTRFGVLLNDLAAHERVLARGLGDLPSARGESRLSAETVAAAGIYALDWKSDLDVYRTVAAPSTPLHVDDLGPEVADVARKTEIRTELAAGGSVAPADIPTELPEVAVRDLFYPAPGLSELGPPPSGAGPVLGTDLGAHIFHRPNGHVVADTGARQLLINTSLDAYARSLILVGDERTVDHDSLPMSESDQRVELLKDALVHADPDAFNSPDSYWARIVEQMEQHQF